ncbi:hypothetical protein ACIF8T_27920 [Streptomyces sp. NPDC085946]|uniref:hypothetical protein n=1 Tax=Streptomyces sp. NPDC085946 TaxID=3365744 RepID=UPI0037D3454A
MTPSTTDRPAALGPETGWAQARRPRGETAPRTCLPAIEDDRAAGASREGPWDNIVRGED